MVNGILGKKLGMTESQKWISPLALRSDPDFLPAVRAMVAKWREGLDVVYGVREKRHGETWFKRLTAAGFYRLLDSMTETKIPLDTGDFRVMTAGTARLLIGAAFAGVAAAAVRSAG